MHEMARQRWHRGRFVWLTVFIVIAAMTFGAYRYFTVKAARPNYLLGTVERGNIVLQVAATGTLQAVTTVQVGTQVSGTIAELHADFNVEVKKGQLLAELDPALKASGLDPIDALHYE